ncbi:MAG: hypothetical protein AABX12_04760 [Nanoarchaeota archaeon]
MKLSNIKPRISTSSRDMCQNPQRSFSIKPDQSHQRLIEQAARHALSEALGYEEAKLYWMILTKQEHTIEKEFSHSKRYRLLKSLFHNGYLAKARKSNTDAVSYILLPPSALRFSNVEEQLVAYLEERYSSEYAFLFRNAFTSLVLKDERGLALFAVLSLARMNAHIAVRDHDQLERFAQKRLKSLVAISSHLRGDKALGIVDDTFAFSFTPIALSIGHEFHGFVASSFASEEPHENEWVNQVRCELESYKR